MIISMDCNVWQKLAEFYEKRIPKSGILIMEGHLTDSQFLHWVKDLGKKRRLLGMAELTYLSWTDIDEISLRHVKASGFPSKESLKRIINFFGEVSAITVAEMRITEVERYWCPECLGVNLNFLNKNIHGNQLPFSCLDCKTKFYTPDHDFGSPRIKNVKLAERYCEHKIKRIPPDQQEVITVAGENWLS